MLDVLVAGWLLWLPVQASGDAARRPLDAKTAGETHVNQRVRSENPAIAAAIESAAARSETLRRLIEAIDATDGLVYVEEGKCGHSVRACLLLSIKVAGPYRLLRIVVDLRKVGRDLGSSVGHELQHAVEVLSNPHITTNYQMYHFFNRVGPTGQGRFETLAAIETGLIIEHELDSSARQAPAGSTTMKSPPKRSVASTLKGSGGGTSASTTRLTD